MPNALVIGLGGVGSVIGQKLHNYDCFERIVLADVDVTFAQRLAALTKASRFEVLQLDASLSPRVAQLISDQKIAITLNAGPARINNAVLEACAQAGSHYLDMASDIYHPPGAKGPGKHSFEAEIEKFNEPFRDKNLVGILSMGMDPGAVNIFARWAMDRLDTATSIRDYNIMHTPFRRDVTRELADACRKQGLAFGVYYSVCDWYHPDFPLTGPKGWIKREKSDIDSYNRYLLAQIGELITNYGPLLTIWNDVPQEFKGRGLNTIRMVRELQPDILINDRTGDGGDYGTPEQRIHAFNANWPWESCMTISAHDHWAWAGPEDGVKPLSACLLMQARQGRRFDAQGQQGLPPHHRLAGGGAQAAGIAREDRHEPRADRRRGEREANC